jgi:RimJ/RimL family protein N-acetyltransferase
MTHTLEFFDDPATFLAAAGDLLAANPVESTVVASVTRRLLRDASDPAQTNGVPRWWLVVRDGDGSAVGAAMRTAPFEPYPAYLLGMPDAAARDLARALHARGEEICAFNGALPAVEIVAAELATLTGGSVRVGEQMRLHRLGTLVDPPPVPGRLRAARADEVDLVLRWFDAFAVDAAEQAGHVDPHPNPIETRESIAGRIEGGDIWIWDDDSGTPVHLTGFSPANFGVARVGPVYTPPELRGHGYAAAAVAGISRRLLDEGAEVCLFTDQANPISNRLYERLGYRRVSDLANLVIDP